MLSSELRSARSLRHFPSVSREYAAVVSHESVAQQYTCTQVPAYRSLSIFRMHKFSRNKYSR